MTMEPDEVIIEKVIGNVILNDEADKEIVKENIDVPSVIKNASTASEKCIKTNVFESICTTNDNEIILIDKNTNMQQQESFTSINNNKASISNDSNKQAMTTDSIENLEQKDDDIRIVHENTVELSAESSNKLCSLSNIALEYGDSDSETESNPDIDKHEDGEIDMLKEIQMQSYRLISSSSSEESDSEDDSTSTDSNSSLNDKSSESDSNDNTNKKSKENNTKGRKHHEMKSELDELPPIEDLKISVPEVLCDPLGEIAWMVEQLVVVRPKPGKPTLNLDTVLFVEKGQRALGKIFDVFGQVSEPHYCVRF
ncbi:H/ACA ribonucleoprotein complex non-core subunit NAF1, partial [Hylaeus volcanicus]|uniref:H/ACA ribonucleoprotein complex non-core subunit NAF1 n=1 Tax=Hylaeus volcanicus TaxID=313075 RepID=UPI0023B81B8D